MKVTFVTNFMSHHLLGIADILYEHFKDDFTFLCQEELTLERKSLGYQQTQRPYIVEDYDPKHKKSEDITLNSDVIIVSYSQGVASIKKALKAKRIVFWYMERLYKDYKLSWTVAKYLRARKYLRTGHNKNQYFLCASSFAKEDIEKTEKHYSSRKYFKFGYYPAFVLEPIEKREENEIPNFLYLGRFIHWKHAEYMISCAQKFKKEGKSARFNLIGEGEILDLCKQKVIENQLEDYISFYPPCSADKVKNYYYSNDFFCFTSDRREGYGSTLAEAMSCGCVGIASTEAGATNLFCVDEENSILFKGEEEFIQKCLEAYDLFFDKAKFNKIKQKGISTVKETWNYQIAGERLADILERTYKNENLDVYQEGPMSLIK